MKAVSVRDRELNERHLFDPGGDGGYTRGVLPVVTVYREPLQPEPTQSVREAEAGDPELDERFKRHLRSQVLLELPDRARRLLLGLPRERERPHLHLPERGHERFNQRRDDLEVHNR